MVSLEATLREIAYVGSGLDDRIALAPHAERIADPRAASRLERWRQAIADGDAAAFAQRLAWEGLSEADALRLMTRARLGPARPLPAWAELLREIFAAAADLAGTMAGGPRHADACIDPVQPVPFEELLLPFVHVARGRLADAAGPAGALLAPAAHGALERRLLQRLAFSAGQALQLEFALYRTRERDSLALALDAGQPSRELYTSFVGALLGGALPAFFREYAALARLLAGLTLDWVDTTAELLGRLAADHAAICRAFARGAEIGPVAAVVTGLSDPHQGGRTVLALTFAGGLRLIYKPRDIGLELAFNQLLAWLNAEGAPLDFTTLSMLEREGYGWVESIEHRPCAGAEETGRFFRRLGGLLCLVYLLEGTDCHHENLIACGEHPVLIDAETLLHHRLRGPAEAQAAPSAHAAAIRQIWGSVLRTSFLPQWRIDRAGRAFDVSALGAEAERPAAQAYVQWHAVNTDLMETRQETPRVTAQGHLPGSGAARAVEDYGDELIAGFAALHCFVETHRAALLAADGPLAAFAGREARVIFRGTRGYALLLQNAAKPERLRDGADRAIDLDRMFRALLGDADEPPLLLGAARAERRALERLDVPLFRAPVEGDWLPLDGGEAPPVCFSAPSLQLARERIAAADEADRELQIGFIRGALQSRLARPVEAGDAPQAPERPQGPLLSPSGMLAHAAAIGAELRRSAISGADGGATWMGLVMLRDQKRYQLEPLRLDLYNGGAGVALFLAALAAVGGDHEAKDLALAALAPLRAYAATADRARQLNAGSPLGAGTGVGSFLYALTRVGRLIGESDLLDDAVRVAQALEPDQIRASREYDVVIGVAGAILGLLAIYGERPDDAILARAMTCGEALLAGRVAGPSGARTWQSPTGKLLAGFSHGAAGIAYALLRLAAVSGEPAFREAAEEAIAYEASCFAPAHGNWHDLRADANPGDRPHFMTSWCHGAPGIGLGRLGGLPALDTPAVRADLETAISTTLEHGARGVDHPCCGVLGRAELLLSAGLRLGRPELVEQARALASGVVAAARSDGGHLLFVNLPRGATSPSFFQGTAGVGYQLLRIAYPERLPAVLLWE